MSVKEYQEKMKSIVSEVLDLQDEEDIQNWFTGISRVSVFGKKYSPSNLLLVFQQKSTAYGQRAPKHGTNYIVFGTGSFGLIFLRLRHLASSVTNAEEQILRPRM